jgi:cellulose synthase/poly-beta-1,6-N-acetylglucosamine synthase-like glycosyltransferase
LEIDPSLSGLGSGVESYWRREKQLRAAEARWDSCIGCTGAVYAIRRSLFEPLPDETILDDVVIPMRIALRGYRVLHDEAALAYDPQPLEPHLEAERKRRTLAGNFQMLCSYPQWLWPGRNRLWLQLISHKYLRLLAPLLLVLILASNAALLRHPFYAAAFLGQCAFYLCAAIGLARPALRFQLVALPAGFVFLNFAVIRAFLAFTTAGRHGIWKSSPPSTAR